MVRRLIFFALVLSVVLTSSSSAAAPGSGGDLSLLKSGTIDQPVEQESPDYFFGPRTHPETWVTNPTGCDWDVDDWTAEQGTGDLAGGASVSTTICLVADQYDNFGGDNHAIAVGVSSTSPDLIVTATNDFGRDERAGVEPDGHGYRYQICTSDSTAGPYPSIADSNGGTGLVVTWTVTVANPTRHVEHSVGVVAQTGFTGPWTVCDPSARVSEPATG